MHDELQREIRRLRRINAVSLGLLTVFALGAFVRSRQSPHFDEITVGRIDVVEPDGTLRLAISNKAHFPDPVIDGKTYPLRSGAKPAGMIFFNDLGDEQGGLIWNGSKTGNGYTAGASLTMDQWRQDQTVQMSYEDESGERWAGFRVIDRPDLPMTPMLDEFMRAMQLPHGPARDSAVAAVRAHAAAAGMTPAQRILVGKGSDKAAVVVLNDPEGKPRIRLRVDSLGTPSLEFLDAAGRVTYALPGAGDGAAAPR
jgi:hypothetical protein